MKKETLELGVKIYKLSNKLKKKIDKFGFVKNSTPPIYDYQFIPAIYLNHQKIANKQIQIKLVGIINQLDTLLSQLDDYNYENALQVFANVIEVPEEVENITPDPYDVKLKKVEQEKSTLNKCPHGHQFGIDLDQFKECSNCSIWEDCDDEHDEHDKLKNKKSAFKKAAPQPEEEDEDC